MNRILKRVACLASAATMLTGTVCSATAAEMRADLKTFLSRAGLSAAEIQSVAEGSVPVKDYYVYVNMKGGNGLLGSVRASFTYNASKIVRATPAAGTCCEDDLTVTLHNGGTAAWKAAHNR